MTGFFLASLLYLINSPVTDMREHPKQESEIVSQAFYSEEVEVLEETPEWVKIETKVDHYRGWIKRGALSQTSKPSPIATHVKVQRCSAHLYGLQDTIYGPILTLPFESKLRVLEMQDANSRWIKVALVDGREGFIQRGDVSFDNKHLNIKELCKFSKQFKDLPYTWGGRSSFGYDCSGYVQMLYRQMGIYLPRDTKDQIRWDGFTHTSLEKLLPGDLIYFGLSDDKIRHVGMYLGKGQFIHSTVAENKPYIRISKLTDPEWNGSGRFAYRAFRTLKAKA